MELENRKKIVHIFQQNPTWSHSSIAKEAKVSRRTVSGVIKRFKNSSTVVRAEGSGPKPATRDTELVKKVKRSVKQNPGLSLRDREKKIGTSHTSVRNALKKAGLKSFKAIKVPNRNEKQKKAVKKRSRKLYDEVLTKFNGCLIIDDETYVKLDQGQVPGQKFYVSDKRLNVPDKFKFIQLEKYGKKVLIWQTVCSCGLKSRSFATCATLNSDLYIEECLEKRLLPFIRSHDSPVMFWPDLASCHYSRKTLSWYETNEVNFIPKECNPPNTPEFRPIEQYWAIVKKIFKKTRAAITNEQEMSRIWNTCSQKVNQRVVRIMMTSIKRKVRKYLRTGELKN